MNPPDAFRKARDFLVSHREDWEAAWSSCPETGSVLKSLTPPLA